VKTPFPFTVIVPDYLKTLIEDLYQDSLADCIAHIIESQYSKRVTRNSLSCVNLAESLLQYPSLEKALIASLLAGSAIQTTGTNFIHALSYPLTYLYQIPHGRALRFLLTKLKIPSFLTEQLTPIESLKNINWKLVIAEAQKYPQYYRSTITYSDDDLLEDLT
jgi:alcohol dehydrogenase YqhD (iron-dependent ADH family)